MNKTKGSSKQLKRKKEKMSELEELKKKEVGPNDEEVFDLMKKTTTVNRAQEILNE